MVGSIRGKEILDFEPGPSGAWETAKQQRLVEKRQILERVHAFSADYFREPEKFAETVFPHLEHWAKIGRCDSQDENERERFRYWKGDDFDELILALRGKHPELAKMREKVDVRLIKKPKRTLALEQKDAAEAKGVLEDDFEDITEKVTGKARVDSRAQGKDDVPEAGPGKEVTADELRTTIEDFTEMAEKYGPAFRREVLPELLAWVKTGQVSDRVPQHIQDRLEKWQREDFIALIRGLEPVIGLVDIPAADADASKAEDEVKTPEAATEKKEWQKPRNFDQVVDVYLRRNASRAAEWKDTRSDVLRWAEGDESYKTLFEFEDYTAEDFRRLIAAVDAEIGRWKPERPTREQLLDAASIVLDRALLKTAKQHLDEYAKNQRGRALRRMVGLVTEKLQVALSGWEGDEAYMTEGRFLGWKREDYKTLLEEMNQHFALEAQRAGMDPDEYADAEIVVPRSVLVVIPAERETDLVGATPDQIMKAATAFVERYYGEDADAKGAKEQIARFKEFARGDYSYADGRQFTRWKSDDFTNLVKTIEQLRKAATEPKKQPATRVEVQMVRERNVPKFDVAAAAKAKKEAEERRQQEEIEAYSNVDRRLLDRTGHVKSSVYDGAIDKVRGIIRFDPERFDQSELDDLVTWAELDKGNMDAFGWWSKAPEVAKELFAGWPKADITVCIKDIDMEVGKQLKKGPDEYDYSEGGEVDDDGEEDDVAGETLDGYEAEEDEEDARDEEGDVPGEKKGIFARFFGRFLGR